MSGYQSQTIKEHYIGKTADGDRVWVSLRLEEKRAPTIVSPPDQAGQLSLFQTRDHRTIDHYTELAMMGTVKGSDGSYFGGQIAHEVDPLALTDSPLTEDERSLLWDLWKRCHLNGMHAGCVHQQSVPTDSKYWRSDALEQTLRCPQGYKYGSRWLVEELSEADLQAARALKAKLECQPVSPRTRR